MDAIPWSSYVFNSMEFIAIAAITKCIAVDNMEISKLVQVILWLPRLHIGKISFLNYFIIV